MELAGTRLFITGIGGFIGLRAAGRARERGMEVTGLEVSEAAAARARAAGFGVSLGDVTDAGAVAAALGEVDVVLHTAAIVAEGGAIEPFRRVNVEGSRTVVRAARAAGASCFVQLSSVMVYGFTFSDGVSEEGPLRGEGNPYCITKIESEEVVLEQNDPEGGFGVIVIRPGDVYGPGSIPWIVRPLALMRRRLMILPAFGRGLINHVHVDNLVDGILAAIERDAHGEAFNLTDGRRTTFREFFDRLAEAGGAPRPPGGPASLVVPMARAGARVADRLGLDLGFDPEGLKFVMRPGVYSIDKARRVLDYEPTVDLDEGFRRLAPGLRDPA